MFMSPHKALELDMQENWITLKSDLLQSKHRNTWFDNPAYYETNKVIKPHKY